MSNEIVDFNNAFNSVVEWHPDETAVIGISGETKRSYSYREINTKARLVANGLLEKNASKGDRIAILSQSTIEHLVTILACWKVGAVPATIHFREGEENIRRAIADIDAEHVFFQSDHINAVEYIHNKDTIDREYIIYQDSTMDSSLVPSFSTPYSQLTTHGKDIEPNLSLTPSDRATINFTSGTTSKPKPIVHRHREIIECARNGSFIYRPRKDDRYLNVASPTFIAWFTTVIPFLNVGATVILLDQWDPQDVLRIIEAESVSLFVTRPTQWKAILEETVGHFDLESIRAIGYGGEPMTKKTFSELRETISDNIVSIYGSTETMNSGLYLPPEEHSDDTLGSLGSPVPNTDVRIVDPDSKDPDEIVDPGEIGEIIIRGPSVSKEVWQDQKLTEKLFHENGWWFSGDLGKKDDQGRVELVGRKDEMIISGGINIYPTSIEEILENHPAIRQVVVVGTSHEKWGEVPKAYVAKEHEVTADQLDNWCKENKDIGDYKRPREYVFVSEIPTTDSGKADKNALQSQHWDSKEQI
jgi:acyl-coenzyme A synthetase/AMP-(fatty) acid ligase